MATISSGFTSTGISLDYDLYVSPGGTANSTTINPGGEMRVSVGGTAILDFNPWKRNYTAEKDAVVLFYDREANLP